MAKSRVEKNTLRRELYQANPEKYLATNKAWERRNPDKVRARQVAWRKANPDKVSDQWLRRIGTTLADKKARLAAQGGVCIICATDTPTCKGWSQDHCHQTGRLRGVLCNNCNAALGYAKDSPDLLRQMANYLEQYQ